MPAGVIRALDALDSIVPLRALGSFRALELRLPLRALGAIAAVPALGPFDAVLAPVLATVGAAVFLPVLTPVRLAICLAVRLPVGAAVFLPDVGLRDRGGSASQGQGGDGDCNDSFYFSL